MAHVVGVPKRDPCRKCQLPVFLAERLMVGKKVYHRTCLKCARCGYQLTPGSFYETEIDDQYCCETCPDEEEVTTEMQMDLETKTKSSLVAEYTDVELRNKFERETNMLSSPTRSVRSSIKERLAFFESQRDDEKINTNLLQKSLSDEEKSKSLQRVESSVGHATASYKPNKALTNFLNNTANDEEDDLSESSSSIQNLKMETSDFEDDDTTDDLTNVSIPPELPKSLPPLDEHSVDKKSDEIQKRFTSSAQLVLGSTSVVKNKVTEISDEQQNIVEEFVKENQTSELQLNLPSCVRIDKTNNNNSVINEEQISDESHKSENNAEQPTEKAVQVYQSEVDNNLEFSETNDNDCITKDKLTDELFMKCIDETTIQELGDSKDIDKNAKSLNPLENESLENINPVIEKNVFENEVIELRTKSEEKERNNVSLSPEDTETTQTLSVVSARLEKFQVITCNKKDLEDLPSNVQENYVDNETMEVCRKTSAQVNNMEIGTENFNTNVNDNKVPLTMETKDNANLDSELENNKEYLEGSCNNDNKNDIQIPHKSIIKTTIEEYPEDLNPFKSDEEDNVGVNNNSNEDIVGRATRTSTKKDNLNPFDSSDDDVELDKSQNSRTSTNSMAKIPPPRPPPPRISRNPFGSEDEDDNATKNFQRQSSLTKSQSKKTPVPTPRSIILQSQNPTPEPTPRLSTKINNTCTSSTNATHNNASLPTLQNSSEYYGSAHSLHSSNTTPYNNLLRNSDVRSSNNSLNLSAGGTIRSRKSRRAPQPPAPVKELFPSNETINSSSKTSTPSSSIIGTPKSGRKKRPAPAPPKPARLESAQGPRINSDTFDTQPKNLNSYPLQSELDSKLSDEEKALLEGKTLQSSHSNESDLTLSPSSKGHFKRLIPLDKELLEEHGSVQYSKGEISQCDDLKQQNQEKSSVVEEDEMNVVYRRVLIPQNLETPTHEHNPLVEDLTKSPSVGERQLEKIKDNKEANNRNRQSQISVTSSGADENDPIFNKSAHGKWKRRKGPAPALPIPPRKVLQMLPLQEIKHELEIIEVQQQGLEKQGVVLEKMIRDRCEGENGELIKTSGSSSNEDSSTETGKENSKEVENLILQLFELVNEKNELFRRQAELMYLRRQHRLEQEQADLEYEIRILMAQPERNKTDSDKAREEALIERLIEVVKLRNEVIECLEMDRIREAEEDQSIKQRLESHIAKREIDSSTKKTLTKLSKKEKKKQKEAKKLNKSKKLDADKDTDESEFNLDKQKSKKKKKLLIF